MTANTLNVSSSTASASPLRLVRIEVHPVAGEIDPLAQGTLAQARELLDAPVTQIKTARVYLIESPLSDDQVSRLANELLADPINQQAIVGISPIADGQKLIEVHYQPGVMDPVAQSTRDAIAEMFPALAMEQVEVRTGWRYDLTTSTDGDSLRAFAAKALANPVIQDIVDSPLKPERFPHGSPYRLTQRQVPICDLDDAALMRMSREAHLFLSLQEMQAIRDHFKSLGREPSDLEIETIAQTWSEHCVHKTLKATITYRSTQGDGGLTFAGRPGHQVNPDGSVTIDNLLKSTVAAATKKLMQEDHYRNWCISVFKDNSGVVAFDEKDAVCIKVETHNHPSAIEPYGGAATGIGGCIRDVMGTGLGAKPIANTDVFAVAYPDTKELPKGVIHPKRILQQVVAGVRDYGNRMGIATVNGAVTFHEDFLGNPLVFAGCIGLIPSDKCFGQVHPGDRIIALGGRTGRDGIHGATFSSAELTDTHADEFSHAVQIGNAITQKKVMDVILQARDHQEGCLYHGLTDCGAGGFSSAIGEMGKDVGAIVELDRAPLKYQGLSYTEIWISEAQERMVLAVPPEKLPIVRSLCDSENVELCDLGQFGQQDAQGQPELILNYQGQQVGRLSMPFLHDGIPTPTRQAIWTVATASPSPVASTNLSLSDALLKLLAHPNIASKHWIVRQYDHEVQGGSVVKPLVGPMQLGPSDASVLRPKLEHFKGIALGVGLQPGMSEKMKSGGGDSYWATLAAIDEAVRNVVCVGADPDHIAILDNFCWPRCEEPANLGSLVRAAEACYDGAIAYRTPFVSGKDSLSNQFTTEDGRVIAIPPTLLISALGIVCDVTRCCTMDAKAAGNALILVGLTTGDLGGAHYQKISGDDSRCQRIPHVDLTVGPATARVIASLIAQKKIASAHDCSDGGLLVAAAEMAFAGDIGLDIELDAIPCERELDDVTAAFAETPSRYLLEVAPPQLESVAQSLRQAKVPFAQIGRFASHERLTVRCAKHGRLVDLDLPTLRQAWLQPLDW